MAEVCSTVDFVDVDQDARACLRDGLVVRELGEVSNDVRC